MIDAHGRRAAATGARIAHACGFDSIPSDLGVLFTQRRTLERFGEPCTRIGMRVKAARGGFSGGTVASGLAVLEELRSDPKLHRLLGNPYALAPEGRRSGVDQPGVGRPWNGGGLGIAKAGALAGGLAGVAGKPASPPVRTGIGRGVSEVVSIRATHETLYVGRRRTLTSIPIARGVESCFEPPSMLVRPQ